MIYKALEVIYIFGADERTNGRTNGRTDERTDEGVLRGPRGPKKEKDKDGNEDKGTKTK